LSAFGDRAREASATEVAMKQYPEIAVERAMKVQEVFGLAHGNGETEIQISSDTDSPDWSLP